MPLEINKSALLELNNSAVHKAFFSFFNVSLKMFSDNKEYIQYFESIYKNFQTEAPGNDCIECYVLDIYRYWDCSSVIIDGIPYVLPKGKDLIGKAEMILFQKIMNRIKKYYFFHAGAVSKNGKAYIFYGPSGYGKTTFVLELVSRGYKFLSDEYCPVNFKDFSISTFHRSVGFSNDSPFKKIIDCLSTEHIEYAGKKYVDCNNIFSERMGTDCRAKCLIFLESNGNKDSSVSNKNIFKIALFNKNRSIIDIISNYNGVGIIQIKKNKYFSEYTLSILKNRQFTSKIENIIRLNENEIFYFAPVKNINTDFSQLPCLKRITKSETIFILLSNLLNRSPSSMISKKHQGKSCTMMMEMGEFVKDIECYRMRTGKLAEMADLVDAL